MFQFLGDLEISKSWMNRALILQSFNPDLKIIGTSLADDVQLLQKALSDFADGKTEFYAGLGGTTFRFLAFRISRQPGEYLIRADEKLLNRPQSEIVNILNQLGVTAELNSAGLKIKSNGWQKPQQKLQINSKDSSQFLSALALSSVNLEFDLDIAPYEKLTSEGYFEMTLQMLKLCHIEFGKAGQKNKTMILNGEVDISSAFSLISAAVLAGSAEITNWVKQSTQPDIQFLNFFNKMNIQFKIQDRIFKIQKQKNFKKLSADLSNCPDLFPVLSVLCAFADGDSDLFNAPQLKYKESDRIEKTYELLTRCGFSVTKKSDGIKIQGQPDHTYKAKDLILFDPAHDHRMAMAAGLLMIKGFPIRLPDMSVVNKSYPQFFQHIGLLDVRPEK